MAPTTVHLSHIQLVALPTAVGLSRAFIRQTLKNWQLTDQTESAELVVSELVTNAVKETGLAGVAHGWEDIRAHHVIGVQLRLAGTRLYVEVWDGSDGVPEKQDASENAEGGRGLLLVEMSSRRWGTYRSPAGGKIVWAELGLSTSACPASSSPLLPTRVPGTFPLLDDALVELVETALIERVLVGLRESL
ncbi:ATP-binding protein [Streptomyces sp. AM 4-1-1]|uniref:ATP-binding protein n=1 Tax=Streptomyces sp. AM 4-1-1 TaxID=3028710 RepID=UPI0023B8D34A|nr:ATP-binding protein [Streptomyces sp. AM 4-1-1]WEH33631.1 ATP-binding protein [Streptomyces sp. AM 4-1-1]